MIRTADEFLEGSPNLIDLNNTRSVLNYFQLVQRKFMSVDNFGLSLDDAGEIQKDKHVFLRDLFVTPNISSSYLTPEQIIGIESNDRSNWHNIVEIISKNPRCFILGDPGMGKSTLIQWLMLALSYSADNSTKAALGPLVPFALTLRELSINRIRTFDDLWSAFKKQNHELLKVFDEHPDQGDVIKDLLTYGQAIIFLDGLDEVSNEEKRRGLSKAVLDGMQSYPNCKFVISSRVVGFNQNQFFGFEDISTALSKELVSKTKGYDLKSIDLQLSTTEIGQDNSIPQFYILPFNYQQAKRFVSNWYSQYHPVNSGNHEHRVSELLARIQKNDGLGHLSRIPVLLNMICFIHARRGRLPDGRAELYQRISDTYLVALDVARGIEQNGKYQHSLDYADRCNLLSEIAYQMQCNRSSEEESNAILISESEVKNILTLKLAEIGIPDIDVENEIAFLLKQFAERSGLFIPRGRDDRNEERFGFTHLSFLEYFAARALKLKLDLGEVRWEDLRLKTKESIWSETFVLFFEQLDHVKLTEHYFHLLFPLKEGVDFLKGSELFELITAIVFDSGVKISLTERPKIIRKLWAILDNDAALKQMPTLINRLWTTNYNSLSFGSEILKKINQLCLTSVEKETLPIISELTHLEFVLLMQFKSESLDILSKLTNLEFLMLFNTSLKDISDISKLKKLNLLTIFGSEIKDLSPILNLKKLEHLSLGLLAEGVNFSILRQCKKLRALSLLECELRDVNWLGTLKNLRRLDLQNNKIVDIQELKNLSKLEHLDLSDNNIQDITPLVSLPDLEVLTIDGNHISDLSSLKACKKLKKISARRNPINKFSKNMKIQGVEILI